MVMSNGLGDGELVKNQEKKLVRLEVMLPESKYVKEWGYSQGTTYASMTLNIAIKAEYDFDLMQKLLVDSGLQINSISNGGIFVNKRWFKGDLTKDSRYDIRVSGQHDGGFTKVQLYANSNYKKDNPKIQDFPTLVKVVSDYINQVEKTKEEKQDDPDLLHDA